MSGATPCVFVVDDDAAVRRSVERLLRANQIPCRAFASGQDFLSGYDPAIPGCVLLDLSLGDENGLELQDALALGEYAPPIVFLSGCASLSDGIRAMKSGALEFLTKPVDEDALLTTIRDAFERDGATRARIDEARRIRARLDSLTRREHDVLRAVLEGKLNKQTAAELGTAEKTIKVHRARVMKKLNARSLAELFHLVARAERVTPRLS